MAKIQRAERRRAVWMSLCVPVAAAAMAGCFTPKGAEQGQVAWLAAGLDKEFPEKSVRPDLEISAAAESHETAAALPPVVAPPPVAVQTVQALPAGPRPDDPASAEPRPVIRVVGVGGPGKGRGEHDRIELSLPDENANGANGQSVAKTAPSTLALAPQAPESSAKREYERGLALLNAHDYSHALEALEAVAMKWPDDPVVESTLYWTGECYLAMGQVVDAADAFEATLTRFPQGAHTPDALFRLGVCADRLGNPEKARGFFARLTQEYPKSDAARRVPSARSEKSSTAP